ncbi:SDR family oxidoreductase [Burkholderia sp. L27(2015)]|uniref:SDR family oxidoreductase n=1 Tax=Burkholderia sp. L27(2015) TaxID=1641858 RepID=UPI00131AB561|nr:SDR family oxidoreductase [Burkholderia sp. L27(2015)]
MNAVEKVIAITGASSGIGEASARLLAKSGATVFLGARRIDKLEQIAAEIVGAGGKAHAHALDVTSRSSMDAFIAAVVQRTGKLDVLVNNAGIMLLGPLDETDPDEWDRMVDVNIKGVLHGIGAALPVMRLQDHGHIINVASIAGHRVRAGATVYCATKHAVRAISEGFRQEAGPKLRSTLISPGLVSTELPDHITHAQWVSDSKSAYEIAIGADVIARAIAYAIEQPSEVDVNEIVIRPTAQSS